MDPNVTEKHDELTDLISVCEHGYDECPEIVPTLGELQVLEKYWDEQIEILTNSNPFYDDYYAMRRMRELREILCRKMLQHLEEKKRKIIEAACRENVMSPPDEDKVR